MTNKFSIVIKDCTMVTKKKLFKEDEWIVTNSKGVVFEPIKAPLRLYAEFNNPLLTLGMFNTAKIKFHSMYYKNDAFLLDCLVIDDEVSESDF